MRYAKSIVGCSLIVLAFLTTGCVESQSESHQKPFRTSALEACLAIVVDMSGSFASWDDQAHQLFLELMDQYFTEGAGSESRIVICQLSGNDKVVLFEGRPEELRSQFRTPEQLREFLKQNSDPVASHVYEATEKTLRYLSSMSGVTKETRQMTAILSDMSDSETTRAVRTQTGNMMLKTLTEYQERGGGLALYYVAPREVTRWQKILSKAGFEPGSFVIESKLVARPQLPSFD